MPIINLFFWSVLLLVAYLTAVIAINYHRAEQAALQELRRLQIRRQVLDACRARRQRETALSGIDHDRLYPVDRVSAAYPATVYSMGNINKRQTPPLRPVKEINQFFDVSAREVQQDVAALSFAWARSSSASQSERTGARTKTCQKTEKASGRHADRAAVKAADLSGRQAV